MSNSESPKDTDRYSRLRAITEYGFDVDFEDLRKKKVVICGVGGVGSLSAEMLVRCGIGQLTVIDLDDVGEENLNRVFYKTEHIGKPKAEVCANILATINPEVRIKHFQTDIMDIKFENTLERLFKEADLIMMGLDNVPARQYVNVKCISLNVPLMDAGALRSGLGGYVHLVIPGKTACYQCTGSVKIQVKSNSGIEGPQCAASLPTTIAMISSMQTQQALKFLLNFGTNKDYINYNGLNDQFIQLILPRDPECYVCGTGIKTEESEIWIELDESEMQSELNNLLDRVDEQEKLIKEGEKETKTD
ncbi:MAG: HesA/MoeB/ThiF family protein [Candidatus Hodarchaeales archaeon]|jgi:ubiquitin-like modifier-activating enzyme 5